MCNYYCLVHFSEICARRHTCFAEMASSRPVRTTKRPYNSLLYWKVDSTFTILYTSTILKVKENVQIGDDFQAPLDDGTMAM